MITLYVEVLLIINNKDDLKKKHILPVFIQGKYLVHHR